MQFSIFLYTVVLSFAIINNNFIFLVLWVIFGICVLCLIPVYKNARIEKIKNGIKNNQIKININKAPYYEIEQLPEFSEISAKKAVWIRKHNGFYSSIEDFCEKNNLDKEKIKNFISL